jgi:hypothetical protein
LNGRGPVSVSRWGQEWALNGLNRFVSPRFGSVLGHPGGVHLYLHRSTGSGQAYDEMGNPVSATLRGTNGRTAMTKAIGSTVAFTHVYEYDDGDRPALSGVEGLTKVDDQAYTWDANGNPSTEFILSGVEGLRT